MKSEFPRYLAVEGVIGVGKTSFAHLLAERVEATLLLEEPFDNPFLADFYRDQKRHAFSTQVFFLLSRFQQLQRLAEPDIFVERIIADYIFEKDALFASVTLSEKEYALYQKMATILRRDVPRPDLVIYLQASTPVIMKRIRKRNLAMEKPIDEEYIDRLNDAYNSFFFHYAEVPLLVVKTDNIDFVAHPHQLNDILARISRPQPQTMYYSPAGTSDQPIL